MIRVLLLIGFGGFLGSIGRYLTNLLFNQIWPFSFPAGTLVVNVIGSLLIGIAFGFSQKWDWIRPEWYLFFATGFCGGYTTFSSFSLENIQLLQNGEYGTFGMYTFLSLLLSISAVFIGILITKI